MFQEDDITAFGFKIDAKVIVAISFLWSLYSFTTSHVTGLTGHRDYFPFSSKCLLLASVLCATLNRVITTSIFFTPPLGLFDILRHYQGMNFLLKMKIRITSESLLESNKCQDFITIFYALCGPSLEIQ